MKTDMDINNVYYLKRFFDQHCLGQETCQIPISSNILPESCLNLTGSLSVPTYSKTPAGIAEWAQLENEKSSVKLYASTECRAGVLGNVGTFVNRETAGYYVVCLDLLLMFIFMITLWALKYYLRLEYENHNRNSFEIAQFGLYLENLPPYIGYNYTVRELEVELVDLIESQIKGYPYQIKELQDERGLKDRQNTEIADIIICQNNLCLMENIFNISTLMKEKLVLGINIDAANAAVENEALIEMM